MLKGRQNTITELLHVKIIEEMTFSKISQFLPAKKSPALIVFPPRKNFHNKYTAILQLSPQIMSSGNLFFTLY